MLDLRLTPQNIYTVFLRRWIFEPVLEPFVHE
jgi:hypothetical protein